ncbi:unnamed protein product [Cylicocyclus nassatus]|uniref:Chondroitin proteoglycan 3 n=1 Tax=Cylicocyclus nassatus TaxID=53992 RepID=A0AA36DNZ4_CYLNA|nr:unnamed protein product [Cylicocyclus nassatus]
MLLLSLLLVTAVQYGGCGPLSKEDDELGTTLDKELEDFLSQAIEDLPGKLDSDFQRVEGSGASASSQASSSASEEEGKEESVVTQMLSTLAETAKLSPYPEATNVVKRLIEEATNDEVKDLVRLASTLSGSSSESTTHAGSSVNGSSTEVGPTTSATLHTTNNFLESASVTTSPSSTSESFATTTEGSGTTDTTSLISIIDGSSESSKDSPPPMEPEASETDSVSLKYTTVSPEAKTFKHKETTRSVLDTSAIECVEEKTCYGDTDCGQGVCLGVFLEKCNCHACVPNIECEDDSDCGGLRGACQNDVCRCAKALATHGFTYYIDALTKFCSQRSCTETSDSCFGLPCGRGICSCRK